MIVRNEQHQLEKCLQSIRPHVAHIAIVDTGSDDNSVEIAKKYADFVETWTGCNGPDGKIQRFDVARNRAFSHATQPWTLWIDGDDEVAGAEHLEELCKEYDRERNGSPSMVYFPYEYSHDHTGRVTMLHERERLMAGPKGYFEWMGWVHEVCVPKGPDMRKHTSRVKIIHRRDGGQKRVESGRNLRILRAQYEATGGSDIRHLYYLGMECGNNGHIDEAIKFLTEHVEKSGWDDERWQSTQLIARHYENRADYEKAIEWGMKSILIREDWGEGYFTVARNCYYMAQKPGVMNAWRWWNRCVHYAELGLSKPPTQTTLFVNPLERDFEIHRYLNLALSRSGRTKDAIESVNKALAVRPDDDQFKLNKRVYEEYEAVEEFKHKLNRLVEVGKITQDVRNFLENVQRENKVPSLSPALPSEAPRPVEAAHVLSDGKLDLVFYTGLGPEPWNPETAKQHGIGGSETAVIEMSRRLASFGHRVRVFGDCLRNGKALEGSFDGVHYLDHSKYRDIGCDVLVSSRRPEMMDASYNVKWKHSVLWVHDIHCGNSLTQERAAKIDRILTLSEWHRGHVLQRYPFLYPAQVQRTRNGIDLARFDKNVERNPHRAVYSSSPDRGLQTAIEIWPRVRQRVPDAELHVYYGFENWEPFADDAQKLTIAHLKKMLKDHEQYGVVYHGRTPQDKLAEEFLKSGVWCYPTWFAETSCITAMEAQAAGLRMITNPIAALNETVGERGTLVAGDWLEEGFKGRFTTAVIDALLKEGDSDRKDLQRYAGEHFSWGTIAQEWDEMLRQGIDADLALPEYQAAAQ
jgi:glycosyltransferase involved in cell wall biosynthesis